MQADPEARSQRLESSPSDPTVRFLTLACCATLVTALACGTAAGQTFDFNGRASGWLGASWDTSFLGQAGLRYLPEARFSAPVGGQFTFDAEASVNGFVSANARTFDRPEVEARLKPYRGFVRVSSPQFEARAGLQKVNFGSAMLLRPLMWFDRVDPRDPLELTDGVYGLLARYCFQNNANVWAWGLIGNSSPKGWETIGTDDRWKPEFGGRAQLPVPRGEVAATYHHRSVHREEPGIVTRFNEDRVGLDGRWDVGVGVSVEATMQRQGFAGQEIWQRAAVLGLDYTLGIGNGLGVVVEHLYLGGSSSAFGKAIGGDAHVSSLLLSYPVGILDNLRAITLYDWRNKGVCSFVGWQRTLDSWLFSATAFWNPDTPVSLGAPGGGAAGKGVQLMVVFNH